MRFDYDGFTQEGNRRCFLFRVAEEQVPVSYFSIQIDLGLLLKNQVPIQAAPMFCLNLLTHASQGESDSLNRLRNYTVVGDDFKELHLERQRQAEEKLAKKPHRRPVRTYSHTSNLSLGSPSDNPYAKARS